MAGCVCAENESEDPAHHETVDFERGPHGGRWLEDGDFALELSLVEGEPPRAFRAYLYRNGEPSDPSAIQLEVALRRLGGRIDRIGFEARGDHLVGSQIVDEPHSFDVEIVAREGGREHRFAFASYENRVTLDPEQLEAAGITLATAGPTTIRERVVLNGRITPNEDALVHVMPRFPGVVRAVHKRLGDPVARGDLVATIESNESLQPFELRAQIPGTVIAKDVAPGEFVSTDHELFQIANLDSVWVDLDAYRRDFGRLRVGQPVRIDAGNGGPPGESTLSYLSPIGSTNTQTLLARAVLANPDRSWWPGLFVTADVEIGADAVPVAVAVEAVQRLRGQDVVFINDGTVFEAQPVELGRRDVSQVEILSGLTAGQRYVATGSFVLKADVAKSGAAHDH
jgi:cobalt-zinc-cadmium efflux system membrane fusion protein